MWTAQLLQQGPYVLQIALVLVWCPLPMLLLAHSEKGTGISSLGLSHDLEAEEKMWRGWGGV